MVVLGGSKPSSTADSIARKETPRMRSSFFYIGFLFFLLLAAQQIMANQTAGVPWRGFAVGPTDVTIDAQSGRRANSKFTIVTQNARKPYRFRIQVMDLGQSETGAKVPVKVGMGARSAARWISIESEVVIQPNSRRVIPFTVSPPPNAKGAYFTYLVVQHVPDYREARMSVGVRPSALVEVCVMTRSRAPLHLDVTDLSVESGSFDSPSAVVLGAVNTGVWKVAVEGDVLLYGAKGTFPIRVGVAYGHGGKPIEIYPGLEVELLCPFAQTLPPGTYKAVTRLLLNGRYQSRGKFDLTVPHLLASTAISGKLLKKSEFDLALWVEPELVEVTLPPGATRTVPIRIQNQDEREAQISLAVCDVHIEKNGFLTYQEGGTSEAGWVRLSSESLAVQPRRTYTVLAQVTVPKDRPDTGALLRAVRLTASAPSKDEEWASENEFAILIVAVDPKAPPAELSMKEPKLIRSSPEKNPSVVVLEVRNSGGRVARVYGQIVLGRASGQQIMKMEIGSTGDEIILPGMEREFRMPLGPLDADDFRVRAELRTIGKRRSVVRSEVTFTSTTAIPEGLL